MYPEVNIFRLNVLFPQRSGLCARRPRVQYARCCPVAALARSLHIVVIAHHHPPLDNWYYQSPASYYLYTLAAYCARTPSPGVSLPAHNIYFNFDTLKQRTDLSFNLIQVRT